MGPRPAPEIHTEFGELLRACDAIDGIERIRFTSPHPKDFRRPVIEAMAECEASANTPTCPAVRLVAHPEGDAQDVQPGALPPARRRAALGIPDLALSTDLIVGFPGETEDDFHETIDRRRGVGFDSAFTFVYSPRAGTEAAAMPEQIPDDLKHDRIERLVEVVQHTAAGATRNASAGSKRCSSSAEPHRPEPAARTDSPQHDRELLG